MRILCAFGFHKWPRQHGEWREIVVSPATSECLRCHRTISSVWRRAYPADGSRCKAGACSLHRTT